jgi:hypothetical protein
MVQTVINLIDRTKKLINKELANLLIRFLRSPVTTSRIMCCYLLVIVVDL